MLALAHQPSKRTVICGVSGLEQAGWIGVHGENRMRLLVVVDSPNMGRDLREALIRDGHTVDLAADGVHRHGGLGLALAIGVAELLGLHLDFRLNANGKLWAELRGLRPI